MKEKTNIIETFTEMAPRYEEVVNDELNRFWGWSYSAFINHLLQMTPIPKNGRMLDIATGTGVIPITVLSQGLGEIRIHGLDITMSMLGRARGKMAEKNLLDKAHLVCASAMEIPYVDDAFDLITCALATHHMDVNILLSETYRVLRAGGLLSVADVGGSNLWRTKAVKTLLRIFAFLYFLFKENSRRAWAEAQAISNVRSQEEWFDLLTRNGYQQISITILKSKSFWIPEPLVIQAEKFQPGEVS